MDWQGILILSMIGCGVFVIGTGLALAWYWLTAKAPLDKDTIWFLVKMFAIIGALGPVGYLLIELIWG